MRILTVRNPWAWAIIHGGKDVENRVRNIAGDYRGPVAIHVAAANAEFSSSEVTPQTERHLAGVLAQNRDLVAEGDVWPWYDHRGSIIGVVDLVDVHRPLWDDTCDSESLCSPWADVDKWPMHLVLANPRPLDTPIPFRGALGLRRLDADTIRQIEEQLA